MLKTNSKKARENIRNYIVETYYNEDEELTSFKEIASDIVDNFNHYNCRYEVIRNNYNYSKIFADYLRGLPTIFYIEELYTNKSCIDLLGNLLEETAEEKARYTEEQAFELLANLIYREVTKVKQVELYI